MSAYRIILLLLFGALGLIGYYAIAETTITTTTTPVTTAPVVTTTPATAVVVERPMIITTVPAPKEAIPIPANYVRCFTVKAGWEGDMWVADHQVCQYENSPSGLVWIEGYWACNKYSSAEGKCTSWDWKPAHWEKSWTVY